MAWLRVNKARKCPACGKDSWCLLSEDGSTAICMRSLSNRAFEFKSGEVGYFHDFSNSPLPTRPVAKVREPEPVINAGALMRGWAAKTSRSQILCMANRLGVPADTLEALGWAWADEHRAWAIPMRDGNNNYVGIRLRAPDGKKWAVRGSHQGIFIPQQQPGRTMFVTEGPTDTCAGIALGFYTVGRPSCSGGIHDIQSLVRRLGINRVVIVSDNDDEQETNHGRNPGISGSLILAHHLPVMHQVVVLPAKDLRGFLNSGGSKALLDCIINQNTWIKPECELTK